MKSDLDQENCPRCNVPWLRNHVAPHCDCGMSTYVDMINPGKIIISARFEFDNFTIEWCSGLNNNWCYIETITRSNSITEYNYICDTDWLPFDLTEDQLKLYLTFL